jgi:hypothetical protein
VGSPACVMGVLEVLDCAFRAALVMGSRYQRELRAMGSSFNSRANPCYASHVNQREQLVACAEVVCAKPC